MCPNQQYSFPGSHPSWLLIQLNRSMYDFGFCSSPLTVFHLTTQCTNDISTSVTEYSMLKFQRHRFWFSTVLGKIILSSEWRLNQHKKPGKGDRSSSGLAAQSQLLLHTMPSPEMWFLLGHSRSYCCHSSCKWHRINSPKVTIPTYS